MQVVGVRQGGLLLKLPQPLLILHSTLLFVVKYIVLERGLTAAFQILLLSTAAFLSILSSSSTKTCKSFCYNNHCYLMLSLNLKSIGLLGSSKWNCAWHIISVNITVSKKFHKIYLLQNIEILSYFCCFLHKNLIFNTCSLIKM